MKHKRKCLFRAMPPPILLIMLLIPLLLAASIGAGVVGCAPGGDNGTNGDAAPEQDEGDSTAEAPRIGYRAPRFSLTDLNGEVHSLEDYAGRAVLINFWTTWCPHCVIEMPLMQELHESGQDIVVLAINVQEKPEDVDAFISDAGYTFSVLLDEQAQVSGAYQVRGLPTTFAVDGTGIITSLRVGAFDAEALAALVESTVK